MATKFKDLTEQEILALAISLEEEHSRTFADYSEAIKEQYPSSAKVFEEMKNEEQEHKQMLLNLYHKRFGNHIPLIQRSDIKGFVSHKPSWLVKSLGLNQIRKQAELIELETQHFYKRAVNKATDVEIRKLLGELEEAERDHANLAEKLKQEHLTDKVKQNEAESQKRLFVLQIVQPGLAGLMDGSVSTLAPIFAAAFSTHQTWTAFIVGLAASVGAGISMGFAEALSDDGSMTGRGKPLARGIVCGLMTAAGGLGHTLPFLIPNFITAVAIAIAVVVVELIIISYIRFRYMDTPFLSSCFQVIVGGVIVFIAGILIGVI